MIKFAAAEKRARYNLLITWWSRDTKVFLSAKNNCPSHKSLSRNAIKIAKKKFGNDYFVLLRLIHHQTVEECHSLYISVS